MKKNYSFRSKVTVMLIIVIVSISFVSFYLYNKSLTDKIYKNAEENVLSILHLVKDKFYYSEHVEQSTISLLKKLEEHNYVLKTYLVNAEGVILYPVKSEHLLNDILNPNKLSSLTEEVTIETFKEEINPYTRIFLKMQNSPSCYECHDRNIKTLGYMVYDISMSEAEKNKAFTLKFSILYTVFLVLILGFVVTIMHYQFVKKSLSHYKEANKL